MFSTSKALSGSVTGARLVSISIGTSCVDPLNVDRRPKYHERRQAKECHHLTFESHNVPLSTLKATLEKLELNLNIRTLGLEVSTKVLTF